MNNEIIIPINTEGTTFYINASKVSLGELIDLKNKLRGFSNTSVVAIDKIIYDYHLERTVYNNFQNNYSRENRKQKERKINKINKHNRRR